MTLPGETEDTVAVYRIPLNENRAYGLARALAENPEHNLRIVDQFLLVDAPSCADRQATGVRYGRRVLHEIAGRDTKGNALTICGRTLNRLGPDYKEVAPEHVPIGQHCLACWR